VSLQRFGTPLSALPLKKNNQKNKGVGHCLSHLLFLVRLLAMWFAYKSAMMMLLIVPDLPLHPHPIVEPGPQLPKSEPIQKQADSVPKVLAIRKEVRRVFREEEDDAWAVCVRSYTMQRNLFALLQVESHTCGIFFVVF
jgi:hypothetical protein